MLIHINKHIYIYGRCIYVQYLTYVLLTFLLLTALTLSLLAIKLVYLDALCLSSDYQEASVLFCHPTERIAKTDNNCHIFDQSLPISSKMHNLLGLLVKVPNTIRNFQDCFPEISMDTGMAYFCLKL